jgi:hypothetical protein
MELSPPPPKPASAHSTTLSMGSGGFAEELNLREFFAFRLGKIVIALNLEP